MKACPISEFSGINIYCLKRNESVTKIYRKRFLLDYCENIESISGNRKSSGEILDKPVHTHFLASEGNCESEPRLEIMQAQQCVIIGSVIVTKDL